MAMATASFCSSDILIPERSMLGVYERGIGGNLIWLPKAVMKSVVLETSHFMSENTWMSVAPESMSSRSSGPGYMWMVLEALL